VVPVLDVPDYGGRDSRYLAGHQSLALTSIATAWYCNQTVVAARFDFHIGVGQQRPVLLFVLSFFFRHDLTSDCKVNYDKMAVGGGHGISAF